MSSFIHFYRALIKKHPEHKIHEIHENHFRFLEIRKNQKNEPKIKKTTVIIAFGMSRAGKK